jgi:Ca2+-binding EF-hand superfamily protein
MAVNFMRIFALVIVGLLVQAVPLLAEELPGRSQAQRLFVQLDTSGDGQLESEEIAGEHARLFARLLRTADADNDGRLSAEEFAEGLKPKRTPKPLAEKPPSRLPGADELLLLVAMVDVDADGTIDPAEVPQRLLPFYERLQERLGGGDRRQIKVRDIARAAPGLTQSALATVKRLELDVDLEYSLLPDKNWALVERLNAPQGSGDVLSDADRALENFRRLDANSDGQVVAEEVPEDLVPRFDRLLARADRNRDQRLSEREIRDFAKGLQESAKKDQEPKRSKKKRKPKTSQEEAAEGE